MKTLKEYITQETEMILEMARIGFMDNYELYIRTDDPGYIPHIHIWDKNTKGKKFNTCVRLDKPEYFLHCKYQDKFNSSECKEFNKFMRSQPIRFKSFNSNYEYAVAEWNQNNSNKDITLKYDNSGDVIIPDYTKLERP